MRQKNIFNKLTRNSLSQFFINDVRSIINVSMVAVLLSFILFGCKSSPEIKVQSMKMKLQNASQRFREELLHGEVADTRIEHISLAGPFSQTFTQSEDSLGMFLFIKGNGTLKADTMTYDIVPETIAIPFSCGAMTLTVPEGDTIHLVQFTKKISTQDLEDLKDFPAQNKYEIYFTKFSDCVPYTEKIKSPNTVSRTVLPADIIPRVSLGTVETKGPDAVGAHEHAMLDQLFLGLTDNDIIVNADDRSTAFKAYDLLHIPIGSSHWASVEDGKKMYYLWMDFFLTKEGQEWLKTHKPISKKMN